MIERIVYRRKLNDEELSINELTDRDKEWWFVMSWEPVERDWLDLGVFFETREEAEESVAC